jgi:calcineurin-like phosphoesterase family protein
MAIYFTSDLHLYHANVIKYCARPFQTVEEMNEIIVKNWNETVGVDDTVYCLGDFAMAFRPVETFTRRLNGIKYLIPGNHDFCHSYHKRSRNPEAKAKWIQKYVDNGWIVLPEQTTLDISGVGTINMCHHPHTLVGDYDDKYAKWRPKDDGKPLLCGHVHDKWKTLGNMINVGVDVWDFKPVSFEQIKGIIDGSNV